MTSGAYEREVWRGVTLNRRTVAMLETVERAIGHSGKPIRLDPMQGSYNAGPGEVPASAGTHDGGGAVDLSPDRWYEVVLAARKVGFAAWHRPYLAGEWGEHIHMIAIGDRQMSSGAANQVSDYYAGRNGLASHGADDGPRVHPIPVFHYNADAPWDTGAVYLRYLHPGSKDSDSVRRVQFRLHGHTDAQSPRLTIDGNYGPGTVEAVRKWQRRVAMTGPNDGRSISKAQAHRMLGESYTVH